MLTTSESTTSRGRTLTSKQLPKATPWIIAVASILVAAGISFLGLGRFSIAVTAVLAGAINAVAVFAISAAYEGRRKAVDRVATTVVSSTFVLACVPLVSLLWLTVSKGGAALDLNLLSRTMLGMKGVLDQQYVAGEAGLAGGFYHAIVGTVLITLAACVISIPIGVLAAIYLVEYAGKNKLGKAITFLVDVMTGIPSIVAGLFAFALFSTIANVLLPGAAGIAKTGFTAAVALSVLMIPIVVRNTEEILRLVPMDLREASYALGVPKWKTIVKIVLPTSVSGILSGVTIAIARVIGETAPIMVTAGFAKSLNWNLFSGWMSTLPTYIYDSQLRPVSPGDAAIASSERAWAAALVLVALVMILNLLARLIAKVLAPKAGR
ncbi:phosphate ABC transporter membrane protein 2 (PhoT family) [Brevibacterium sanguinis]|uniref:Phosphate transport system permease protein PstA n=2 Tax=Brevibacterium TaxID=1696 RepID=A0A366IJH4_9MICO|nr:MULTISPECIES: phosphate ABC transporter permease PstA [Brevibacterium]RBP65646.1 phosphate ABC transporter membrane protein 2 (PhoT family) [Brevibacterium sanguinis]RBP72280.1 phosphate ABC transporter membrane protein 2 (PhoT family) [Brevibacterium celere]